LQHEIISCDPEGDEAESSAFLNNDDAIVSIQGHDRSKIPTSFSNIVGGDAVEVEIGRRKGAQRERYFEEPAPRGRCQFCRKTGHTFRECKEKVSSRQSVTMIFSAIF
jgi:hypothetical protein